MELQRDGAEITAVWVDVDSKKEEVAPGTGIHRSIYLLEILMK